MKANETERWKRYNQILVLVREGASVRRVGRELGLGSTAVYYHVKALCELGLLEIVIELPETSWYRYRLTEKAREATSMFLLAVPNLVGTSDLLYEHERVGRMRKVSA